MVDKSEHSAYIVLRSEKLGRYVVAARDLEAGEEVLVEDAAAVGPKHHTQPLCLGCHAVTSGEVTCSKCGWPVCGPQCEDLPVHEDNECAVFAAAKVKFGPPPPQEHVSSDCPQLECITPLRLLLTTQGDRWKSEVSLMESHDVERRGGSDWQADDVNIVKFLRERCGLMKYSEELIHQVCGILAVNAFEAHSHSEAGDNTLRAIFPQLALLAHNCVPNTAHSIDRNFRVRVRTTVRVAKGEPLYSTYTNTLHSTYSRRKHLKLSKYFECTCPRCCDPTELGSHLSTFKCPRCEWGWVVPSEPLNEATDWKCEKCQFIMPNQAVVTVLERLYQELSCLPEDDVETREMLLKKYQGYLHPLHSYMLELKHALCHLYGRAKEYTFDEMPDIIMERKIELCQQVLRAANIIEPNKTRLRGMLLYELHAPLIMLSRSQFQQGVLAGHKLLEKMKEAENILAEAVDILSLEHQDTMEGQLAVHGAQALQQLRESLQQLPQHLNLNNE